MIYLGIIMILIAVYEVPIMLRRGHYRTLLVFAGLWILSGTYAALFILGAPLPDFIGLIISLLK